MAILVLVACVLAQASDAPKDKAKGVPKELQGTWVAVAGSDGKGIFTGSSSELTLADGKAEWTSFPYVTDDKGKGTVTVDSSKKPPTIELKVGTKTYKGIYRLDEKGLRLLLSEAGGDFPKQFAEGFLKLPEGFKGSVLVFDRKRPKKD